MSASSSRLRLLHCTAGYAPAWTLGGPPRSTANLCEGLAARGHEVVVFTTKLGLDDRPDLPDGEPVRRNGVTVHYFPLSAGPGIRSAALASAVERRAGEFDLMHVTGVWQPTSIPACRSAVRRGVPYVVSPRGALSEYSFTQKRLKKVLYWWGWERRHLSGAAAVHYTAVVEQEECARLRPRAPGFVVPNSMDLDAWRYDPAGAAAWRACYGIASDDFVFLSSGRLHHKKGLELLVESARRLPPGRSWKLVFCGPDEDGTGLRLSQIAREAGLGEHVRFTGALDTPGLCAAYSAAGLFLFPSLNENFGNVAVEALACGMRVALAPGVGCQRELTGMPGVAVLARTPEAWSVEMADALSRGPLAESVRAGRRKLLEQRYSRAAVATAMEAVYRGIVACRVTGSMGAE